MKLIFSIVTFLALNLGIYVESQASSSWIGAFAKVYPDSTSYATNVYGEFIVDYYNESLVWGSEVTIHVGFTKAEFVNGKLIDQSDWTQKQTKAMQPIGPYKWGYKVEQSLYSRGSSSQLTKINFVIEIRMPDGTVYFEKGNGPNGYFRAVRPELGQCGNSTTSYCSLVIENF